MGARTYAVAAAISCFVVLFAGCGDDNRRTPGGMCTPTCSGFQMCCRTGDRYVCSTTATDPSNCGGCGITCMSGETCRSGSCQRTDGAVPPPTDGGGRDSGPPTGMCSPSCSSSQRCCGSTCSNLSVAPGTDGRSDSSFMNCNGCGIMCNATTANACTTPIGMGGAPSCRCGNFPACAMGTVCAMGSTGTFQCVNTSTDPNNCGMVGHRCATGETCTGGMCGCGGATCGMGESCCGGRCINTTTDGTNCGMCGRSCGSGTTCSGGMCLCGTRECAAPSGGSLGELCCGGACVAQNGSNCGACGTMCDASSGEMCINGMSLTGGTMICCGISILPGMPGFCLGGGLPGGDGGLPFPIDGGFPIP